MKNSLVAASSVRPSVRSSVRPSVRPSVHPSVRPSVRPFHRPVTRQPDRPVARQLDRPSDPPEGRQPSTRHRNERAPSPYTIERVSQYGSCSVPTDRARLGCEPDPPPVNPHARPPARPPTHHARSGTVSIGLSAIGYNRTCSGRARVRAAASAAGAGGRKARAGVGEAVTRPRDRRLAPKSSPLIGSCDRRPRGLTAAKRQADDNRALTRLAPRSGATGCDFQKNYRSA